MNLFPPLYISILIIFHSTFYTVKSEDDIPEPADEMTTDDGQVLNKMEFKSPTLNEEEQYGHHMPDAMKCDACLAIADVVWKILGALKEKPTDLELIEAAEKFCSPKSYEGYGVKELNGKRLLSGPGINTDSVPGVMLSGGMWLVRFATQCAIYMGEIDEDELFDVFKENRKPEQFREFLCYGKGVFSQCSRLKKKDEL